MRDLFRGLVHGALAAGFLLAAALGLGVVTGPVVSARTALTDANKAARDVGRIPLLPYQAKARTLGTVNCASSLCHGSVTEWQGSRVLQNEYITWSRTDRHARAALVLLNARSQQIAKNLNLKEPAHRAKICLDCHAHNPDPALRGARVAVSDGIGCEGCHGPAEGWIASHTEVDATHAQNIARGLYPSARPVERARLCLSCHLGNADRFVTHRIMGAGHPRMSFELETFSNIGPAHYRVDDDYVARKGSFDGAKVWAVGQAVAVSEMMKVLAHPERSRDGLFPELVLFDCHACHHPMSELRWKPKTAFGASPGPGVARLNDANALMLRAILKQIDAPLSAEIESQVNRLHLAVAGQGDALKEAAEMKRLADLAALRIEASTFGEPALRGVTLALVDEGLAGHYSDYAAAEQAVMAIGGLVNYMNRRGLVRQATLWNRGLEALRAPLANDESYKPADLQARLREFRTLLESAATSSTKAPADLDE
jgi:hypothetical protein